MSRRGWLLAFALGLVALGLAFWLSTHFERDTERVLALPELASRLF